MTNQDKLDAIEMWCSLRIDETLEEMRELDAEGYSETSPAMFYVRGILDILNELKLFVHEGKLNG